MRGNLFTIFVIIAFFLFVTLAIFAKQYQYFWFDLILTRNIQDFNPFWFDLLMKLLTNLGFLPWSFAIIGLVCLIIFFIGRKIESLILVFSVLGASILSETLKNIISRPRPTPDLVNQITMHTQSDSFPSGHVLIFISFFGVLVYYTYTLFKKNFYRDFLIFILSMLILLIGISRIYLGDHWFSDVLGSYLIGFIWLNFIVFLYKISKKRF
ncbi:phosphatase PAP2 family protein [Candidatus Daviesbacteria bacterium]|nr:phosphatase PAP2 family protein [Candidatus Daviesbacteria bacterium]